MVDTKVIEEKEKTSHASVTADEGVAVDGQDKAALDAIGGDQLEGSGFEDEASEPYFTTAPPEIEGKR